MGTLHGGVRAPRPTSNGKVTRRAACPQAAVQYGGCRNIPRASNARPYIFYNAKEHVPSPHMLFCVFYLILMVIIRKIPLPQRRGRGKVLRTFV